MKTKSRLDNKFTLIPFYALVTEYQERIANPILNRMDTAYRHRNPTRGLRKLSGDRLGKSSENIRTRIESVRERHRIRFSNSVNLVSNSDIRMAEVRQLCKLDEIGKSLVRAVMSRPQLSAGVYHRILKLTRTIADLAWSNMVHRIQMAEVLQYRLKLMLG